MPNECSNNLTIVCQDNPELLEEIYKNEFNILKDKYVSIKTECGLIINISTAWRPIDLVKLLNKYDKCWIKNEWEEEGGVCGVCVGGYLNGSKVETKSLEWLDVSIEGKSQYFNKTWYK